MTAFDTEPERREKIQAQFIAFIKGCLEFLNKKPDAQKEFVRIKVGGEKAEYFIGKMNIDKSVFYKKGDNYASFIRGLDANNFHIWANALNQIDETHILQHLVDRFCANSLNHPIEKYVSGRQFKQRFGFKVFAEAFLHTSAKFPTLSINSFCQ